MKQIKIIKNRYVDSVTLMSIGEKTIAATGAENAEAQMATPANLEVLSMLGYGVSAGATPNDLVLAVTAKDKETLDRAFAQMEALLDHRTAEERVYRSLDEIDLEEDPFDLVQISLPGKYAAVEAEKALRKGLDVFIFSDNVPIEDEVRLKELGLQCGRLVMGPDCGVGILKGVALAAGSIVRRGRIGIIGASGSGAQEVACVIERCGLGVSSLIGTGGRDLSAPVGGRTMLQALDVLERDPETDVIVLVSKVADTGVMDRVLTRADRCQKPVIAVFLGAGKELFAGHRVHYAEFLADAAVCAAQLAGGGTVTAIDDEEVEALAEAACSKFGRAQKWLRALYCGGTFAEESLLYWEQALPQAVFYGNLPGTRKGLGEGHTVLDLGAEEYTESAPHPVFEPALRNVKLKEALKDPAAAVVVFDVITGPGVHAHPADEAAKLCREAIQKRGGALAVVANVCGAEGDPQNVAEIVRTLKDAGVIVAGSNKESARIVAAILRRLV